MSDHVVRLPVCAERIVAALFAARARFGSRWGMAGTIRSSGVA